MTSRLDALITWQHFPSINLNGYARLCYCVTYCDLQEYCSVWIVGRAEHEPTMPASPACFAGYAQMQQGTKASATKR